MIDTIYGTSLSDLFDMFPCVSPIYLLHVKILKIGMTVRNITPSTIETCETNACDA